MNMYLRRERRFIALPLGRVQAWTGPISWTLVDGYVQSDDRFVESATKLMDASIQLEGQRAGWSCAKS